MYFTQTLLLLHEHLIFYDFQTLSCANHYGSQQYFPTHMTFTWITLHIYNSITVNGLLYISMDLIGHHNSPSAPIETNLTPFEAI